MLKAVTVFASYDDADRLANLGHRIGPASVAPARICFVDLAFSLLDGIPLSDRRVGKPFAEDPRFSHSWWAGDVLRPRAFYSFTQRRLGEVARAQINPRSTTGVAYPTWTPPRSGAIEVELFEVRTDVRGRGIGRAAVALLLDAFPPPAFAISLGEDAENFWRSMGWAEHLHADAADYDPGGPQPDRLFVQRG